MENEAPTEAPEEVTSQSDETTTVEVEADDIESIVAKQVSEAVKDVKSKLDKAYAARDEALRKLADIEKNDKKASLKALEEAGKWKEASELLLQEEQSKYAELSAKYEALLKENVEMNRDSSVRDALRGISFRSAKAENMAFREIADELIRDDNGNWIHKSGTKLTDFVKSFVSDEGNSFLIAPKSSTGSGSTSVTGKPAQGKVSIFARKQEDVLKAIAEGKSLK